MNDIRLLQETLREWSEEAQVPHDLADQVLNRGERGVPARRPRLTRATPLAAGFAAVVVVLAVVGALIPSLRDDEPSDGPASTVVDLQTDTSNSPPRHLISAGRVAVSAVYTTTTTDAAGELRSRQRSWSVYDPASGDYKATSWSWVDVAPGLERAAVLQGDLPSSRVGIVDLRSGAVRWIDVDHPVGGLSWSPDGQTVLATAYSKDPDLFDPPSRGGASTLVPSSRTGFVLVDVDAGTARFHPLPALAGLQPTGDQTAPSNGNTRQDLGWSLDGTAIWGLTSTVPDRVFYDLQGRPLPAGRQPGYVPLTAAVDAVGTPVTGRTPATYVPYSAESAVSPDGRLVIDQQSGLPTSVADRATGKVVGRQDALQLLAWADNDHLVALGGCAAPCRGKEEFHNGLVLVSVDGTESRQLSALRKGEESDWSWLLTRR